MIGAAGGVREMGVGVYGGAVGCGLGSAGLVGGVPARRRTCDDGRVVGGTPMGQNLALSVRGCGRPGARTLPAPEVGCGGPTCMHHACTCMRVCGVPEVPRRLKNWNKAVWARNAPLTKMMDPKTHFRS